MCARAQPGALAQRIRKKRCLISQGAAGSGLSMSLVCVAGNTKQLVKQGPDQQLVDGKVFKRSAYMFPTALACRGLLLLLFSSTARCPASHDH